ncbi:Nif3-like dinuclear metal center hexameric protein [Salsipaludibacter albus]|uniref:Nif3-like dinuclear metal center hexameric protein n=1 Tax=Salsipaludibacter albus TaxID=2849650 RepID=UPI001EE48C43|nr:Nif3-like dinuclear metal center hexameric protein [Salsipaludibacter albus]MBY5163941.1 Nif3-like dinuclear metal center hexameric protein [Salsipaludibacter albus]
MTDTVADWLALVDARHPFAHAQSWDHVGLQVGAPDDPVTRVLVSLDVTSAVVEEAAAQPGTLVLAHHPLLFRPLPALTPDTATGRVVLAAARAGVAVAAAHTNLDVATDGAGTSDPVVTALELVDVAPLQTDTETARERKLVTFVPTDHLEDVLDALAAAGAGVIGDYTHCSFSTPGQGRFRPDEGADPFVADPAGPSGRTVVDEARVEVVVARDAVEEVVDALRVAHPYEEVAVDVYPLADTSRAGLGRRGRLPEPTTLGAVAERLRDRLPAPDLRVAGDPDRVVETVAVVGGAGDSMVDVALAAGVDVYVTGDLRHHVVLDALEQGLALVDAGHHAVEVAAMVPWIELLRADATGEGLSAPVVASNVSTRPWSDLPPAGSANG